MNRIATDCHECYLESVSMPAISATADGDFFCRRHEAESGLDPALLMTIGQYIAMKGLNRAADVRAPQAPKAPKAKARAAAAAAGAPLSARLEQYNGGPLAEPPQPKEEEVPKVKEKHFCDQCPKQIRKDSPDGLCKSCRGGTPAQAARKPRKPRAVTHVTHVTEAPKKTAAAAAPPRTAIAIALSLNGEQLNHWFAGLSIEDQGSIFQCFYDGANA